MHRQPISVYTSLFDAIINDFDYADALDNFTQMGDECVIAIQKSKDNTLEAIKDWQTDHKDRNIKIIETNFSRDDSWFDGKIKNAALQQCKYHWCIHLDADERAVPTHLDRWVHSFNELEKTRFKAFLVPNLDLWGDIYSIRWDNTKKISFKFSMHFRESVYRGPIKQARLPNGCINTKISDGTEPILEDGTLLESPFLLPEQLIMNRNPKLDDYLYILKHSVPYVFHLGYANLSRRVKINKNFWINMWAVSSGKKEEEIIKEIPLSEMEMFKVTYPHNLPLWKEELVPVG